MCVCPVHHLRFTYPMSSSYAMLYVILFHAIIFSCTLKQHIQIIGSLSTNLFIDESYFCQKELFTLSHAYVLYVICLFVILVISHFGIEAKIEVLIVPVPDLCLFFNFKPLQK